MNECFDHQQSGIENTGYFVKVVEAYASIMHVHPEDISPSVAKQIFNSLIAHAYSDTEAAKQAGITLEKIHHDRTTLNAFDGLPLLIVARSDAGRLYFSRPIKGWPRPGHRHRM